MIRPIRFPARSVTAVWMLGLLAMPVWAEDPPAGSPVDPMDEPLVTDRPDFTESAEVVPARHLQLESGYTFTYDNEHDERLREHTAPELLLRIGVIERFELRIGWVGYVWSDRHGPVETRSGRRATDDDWTQGSNDMSLGFKVKMLDQNGAVPSFAVIGAVTVPSGSSDLSSGDVDPGMKLCWAYDLSETYSLAGNLNFAGITEEGDRFFQTSASITVGFELGEQTGGYVEYFGFYPNTRDSDCAHSINGGLTYQFTKDFQVDWRIGAGLNEEADDFFTGVGFAWRF